MIFRFLTGLTMVSLLGGCSSMAYQKSDHFDGDRFHNPGAFGKNKGLLDVLKWKLTSKGVPWPPNRENKATPEIVRHLSDGDISVTFISHATHLIQVKGVNILTDPVFSERASPFSWLGPKRVHRPGVEMKDLPPIHFVLVSHNHYDHMDEESLRALAVNFDPVFVVPLGNERLIKDMGAKKIIELDWWQTLELPEQNVLTLVPAQHWSRRSFFDTNKALWGGFVIKTSHQRQIYFAGDTGYAGLFKDIKNRLGKMDVSILPIGAYEPRWFMKEHHMNPEEAAQAHLDLESKFSLATHFGTFQLTDEGIDDPVKALGEALNKLRIDASHFVAPAAGQTHFLPTAKSRKAGQANSRL